MVKKKAMCSLQTDVPGADIGMIKIRQLLAIRSAVEISFLTEEEQYELHAMMELEQCIPNISQANRFKEDESAETA